MKRNLKIFLSFDKEVEEDIVRFGDFLCGFNSASKDIEFIVFKSEEELCKSLEHSNELINEKMETCNSFIIILGSKNDKYVIENLDNAIKLNKNIDIRIFVNTQNKKAEDIVQFFASDKYEHYVEQFEYIDTLKLKFLTWLAEKNNYLRYEVDKNEQGIPVIKVDGIPVTGLVQFEALLFNDDYKDMTNTLLRKKNKRDEYNDELKITPDDENEGLKRSINNLDIEIAVLLDNIALLAKDTFETYKSYTKMVLQTGYDKKMRRVKDFLEQGKLDRAREELDLNDGRNILKANKNEKKLFIDRIANINYINEHIINRFFMEIQLLKLNLKNDNRFIEIEKLYEEIEREQEECELDMTVLFDFHIFLFFQRKYEKAYIYAHKHLNWFKNKYNNEPSSHLIYENLKLCCNKLGKYDEELEMEKTAKKKNLEMIDKTNANEAIYLQGMNIYTPSYNRSLINYNKKIKEGRK